MAKRKQFQTLAGNRKPKSSSLHHKRPEDTLIFTSNEHEKADKRLREAGDWCEVVLLTLSPRAKRYDAQWPIDMFIEALRMYYGAKKELVNYHIVSNRGRSGRGQCSAHVVFEEPLPDIELLERYLHALDVKTKVTSAGEEAVFYMSENIAQPDAIEQSSKWRDHERR